MNIQIPIKKNYIQIIITTPKKKIVTLQDTNIENTKNIQSMKTT